MRLLMAFCVVMVWCVGVGCRPNPTKGKAPDNTGRTGKKNFIFNSGPEPEQLDPHQATSVDAFRLVSGIYEGLLTNDPKTAAPVAGVAEKWEVSPDGKTYTMYLRQGAKWSDGKPLTAQDFIASFQRALDPKTAASYATLFYQVVGARDFNEGKLDDFSKVGVKAVDETTLVFQLSDPCGYFLELLTQPIFYPMRTDLVAKFGEKWSEPGNLVTNGPFVLKEWRHRDRLILVRNKCYWDAANVKLDKVTARCIDDQAAAYKAYLAKDVHWLPSVPEARLNEIRIRPDFYRHSYFGTYFYRFNVTKKPFDNAQVRRAFSMATDRLTITKHVTKAGQRSTRTFCPKVAGYEPVEGPAYDARLAREILAKAGFANGEGLPLIEIKYNTGKESHKLIAEAIAQQWERNLGVKVTTRNVEWKVFLEDMRKLNYMVCRSSWIGDYGDPSTFFDCFESSSGNNRTGWKSPEYDKLIQLARIEPDSAKRLQHFAQAEELLLDTDCVIVPIYRDVSYGMLSKKVKGWYPNIRSIHPLKNIDITGAP